MFLELLPVSYFCSSLSPHSGGPLSMRLWDISRVGSSIVFMLQACIFFPKSGGPIIQTDNQGQHGCARATWWCCWDDRCCRPCSCCLTSTAFIRSLFYSLKSISILKTNLNIFLIYLWMTIIESIIISMDFIDVIKIKEKSMAHHLWSSASLD